MTVSGSISDVGGSPTLRIHRGGHVNTINVGYGGVYISGGVNTINQSQGFIIVSSNGNVNNAYTSGRDFHVSKGAVVNSLTISNGIGITVFNSGIVSSCIIIGSGAILKVSSGGIVNNLTMSRGKLSAFADTSITNLTVSSATGGRASCTLRGTSVTNMLLNNGGGTIYNTIVDNLNASRGYIIVNSSSIISSANINCSDFILRNSAKVISATFNDDRQGSGKIAISNGGVISNLNNMFLYTVPNGQLIISSGGTAINCNFNNFIVSSGGVISNFNPVTITIDETTDDYAYWGQSIIQSGGIGLLINCGLTIGGMDEIIRYDVQVQAGAYVSGYNVTGWNDIIISSGTTIFNMNIISGNLGAARR